MVYNLIPTELVIDLITSVVITLCVRVFVIKWLNEIYYKVQSEQVVGLSKYYCLFIEKKKNIKNKKKLAFTISQTEYCIIERH